MLASAASVTAQSGVSAFFDRFSAAWMRADPLSSTFRQFFPREEQDRLDAQLTPVTAAFRKQRVATARRALAELRAFDRAAMTAQERISARMLEWQLDAMIESARFDAVSYPFNQGIAGLPGTLFRFLTDIHPTRDARDVTNYLSRLGQVSKTLDDAITESKNRAAQGIVPPRFILTATLGQIERLVTADPARNVLVSGYAERLAKAPGISAAARARFEKDAAAIVQAQIVPALHRVSALLGAQAKTATDDAGLSRLPDGAAAYARYLRNYTSTNLTADQIHRTGLEQVARLEKEMDGVLRQMGYTEGTVNERYQKAGRDHQYPESSTVRDQILADYTTMISDAGRGAEALFDLRPKASVIVRRIPEYAERNAAANYSTPARDGSRPGHFNVPLVGPRFSKLGMRSLTHHEAIPGHHFQLALQQENAGLPRFRADNLLFIGVGAFAEGWGLYAEALALENGWYDGDLPSKLGALNAQLFRARRLVVDTGLHTKGWTRQQVIDYGISVAETERYVAAPGQACSYMIGQLKILELRDRAKRALGTKFSIKEFHNTVLTTGTVPLEVLEEVVDAYIASRR